MKRIRPGGLEPPTCGFSGPSIARRAGPSLRPRTIARLVVAGRFGVVNGSVRVAYAGYRRGGSPAGLYTFRRPRDRERAARVARPADGSARDCPRAMAWGSPVHPVRPDPSPGRAPLSSRRLRRACEGNRRSILLSYGRSCRARASNLSRHDRVYLRPDPRTPLPDETTPRRRRPFRRARGAGRRAAGPRRGRLRGDTLVRARVVSPRLSDARRRGVDPTRVSHGPVHPDAARPEGRCAGVPTDAARVLTVERLDATIDWFDLVRGRFGVDEVRFEKPTLRLSQRIGTSALNLAR